MIGKSIVVDAVVHPYNLGADNQNHAAQAQLDDLTRQVQSAVADVRRLVYGLRPPAVDDLGLIGAMLKQDPDVKSETFFTHQDAYNEFKKIFADQKVLIETVTPAGVPAI